MAAVTICSDFGAQKIKSDTVSTVSPSISHEVKEESEKVGLKLNIQKTKIMASSPITLWQINKEIIEQWETLFSLAPKSLQMVSAAMKLKDACSLKEKLWQT